MSLLAIWDRGARIASDPYRSDRPDLAVRNCHSSGNTYSSDSAPRLLSDLHQTHPTSPNGLDRGMMTEMRNIDSRRRGCLVDGLPLLGNDLLAIDRNIDSTHLLCYPLSAMLRILKYDSKWIPRLSLIAAPHFRTQQENDRASTRARYCGSPTTRDHNADTVYTPPAQHARRARVQPLGSCPA